MEGWKAAGRLEGWKAGRLEGCWTGRLEDWKAGRLEAGRLERLEGWRAGRLEGCWRAGRLEGWLEAGDGKKASGCFKVGRPNATAVRPSANDLFKLFKCPGV